MSETKNEIRFNIKPITEKAAQELADAFEKANACMAEFNRTFSELCPKISRLIQAEFAKSLVALAEKYASASFLTRWYYKRKIVILVKEIPWFESLISDVFEKKSDEEG